MNQTEIKRLQGLIRELPEDYEEAMRPPLEEII
jgi:hypothetical protein